MLKTGGEPIETFATFLTLSRNIPRTSTTITSVVGANGFATTLSLEVCCHTSFQPKHSVTEEQIVFYVKKCVHAQVFSRKTMYVHGFLAEW